MSISFSTTSANLRAISNENRLKILTWILDPTAFFPPQKDGDLVDDGVCVALITQKIGLKQPTVTAHMKILAEAGLVGHKQIKNWVFYKPDRAAIAVLLHQVSVTLDVSEEH